MVVITPQLGLFRWNQDTRKPMKLQNSLIILRGTMRLVSVMIAARALYFFYTIVNEILFASFFILSACAIIYHQVINKSPLDGYLSPQTLLFVDLSLYSVNSK